MLANFPRLSCNTAKHWLHKSAVVLVTTVSELPLLNTGRKEWGRGIEKRRGGKGNGERREGREKTRGRQNDESNSYILDKISRGDLQEFLGALLCLPHPLHIGHQLSDLLLQAVVSLHQCLRFSGGEQLEKDKESGIRLFFKWV